MHKLIIFFLAVLVGNVVYAGQEAEMGIPELVIDGQPLKLTDVDYRVQVNGMLATVTLTQRFENNLHKVSDAVYRFPLGDRDAVRSMVMSIGERRITAELRERAGAAAIYKEAQQEGRRAALTEQMRPNLFRQSIANISPGEAVEIELNFTTFVDYKQGVFVLRLPFAQTPRYQPQTVKNLSLQHSNNGWFFPVLDGEPNVEIQATRRNVSIDLNAGFVLDSIRTNYSTSFVNNQGSSAAITMNTRQSNAHDFVLEWRAQPSHEPMAAVFNETVQGELYSTLMILPPSSTQGLTLPKDVVFVLDISGSMQGASIEQAKQALVDALYSLGTADRFNIVAFNNEQFRFATRPLRVNDFNINRAVTWVRSLRAEQGTDMLPALRLVDNMLSAGDQLTQVIFITDGAVSNEDQLFRAIQSMPDTMRLFTVGIGGAPNTYFMRKSASWGRGSYVMIDNINQVQGKMDVLFNQLARPVITDIQVSTTAEAYPQRVPDLYAGEPLIMSFKGGTEQPIVLRGEGVDGPWELNLTLDSQGADAVGLSSIWARSKIESLQDQLISGGNEEALRAEIIKTSLLHQVASQFTSFVAVEERSSLIMPYPKTALGLAAKWWIGAIALLLIMISSVWRRFA